MLENMKFRHSKYTADGSTYICMESEYGEPWCDVTVCLDAYDMTPEDENHIFIPSYKMNDETITYIMDNLVDKNEPPVTIPIGYGTGLYVKLVDNWKDIVEEI